MKKKSNLRRAILLAILFAVVLSLPNIINNDYWTVVFIRVLINVVVVLGLNFITGLIGQMNLGTAASTPWARIPRRC